MKFGVVDVGGGLRDVYGLGIFDYCLDAKIHFDLCIGVSAGSANVTSYLAGQRNRNYPFYTVYPFRKEYMSLKNLLTKGAFLDVDYVYGTLSAANGENPLDYPALVRNPGELIIVATEAETAKPVYFTKDDVQQDHYEALSASSSIPFVCKPHRCRGIDCYDGAMSDSVPFQKAFDEGCDKVVVILTKPKDMLRTPSNDPKFAALVKKKYPKSAEALKNRYLLYNRQVEEAKKLEAEGKVLILAPDSLEGMSTLKKDVEAMEKLYKKGYKDAQRQLPAFLGIPDPVGDENK